MVSVDIYHWSAHIKQDQIHIVRSDIHSPSNTKNRSVPEHQRVSFREFRADMIAK